MTMMPSERGCSTCAFAHEPEEHPRCAPCRRRADGSHSNWTAPVGHSGCPEPDRTVNPKEIAGSKKPATWSVMPRWVSLVVGRIMTVGAAKYGAFNYRQSRIAASTYQDAMERHMQLWFDGEDDDPETGESHLASVIASCSLLMDAQKTGKLTDDRQKTGLARSTLDRLERRLRDEPLPTPTN